PDDAGLDLASAEEVVIPPGGRALVGTGLAVALPAGTVGLVCPRSGLAARHGITVLNGPGIVDAGYRGPVKVALHNTDLSESFALHVGDRVAQLVVVPFLAPRLDEVEDLDETVRAGAGFGSSGGVGAGRPSTAADESTEGRAGDGSTAGSRARPRRPSAVSRRASATAPRSSIAGRPTGRTLSTGRTLTPGRRRARSPHRRTTGPRRPRAATTSRTARTTSPRRRRRTASISA